MNEEVRRVTREDMVMIPSNRNVTGWQYVTPTQLQNIRQVKQGKGHSPVRPINQLRRENEELKRAYDKVGSRVYIEGDNKVVQENQLNRVFHDRFRNIQNTGVGVAISFRSNNYENTGASTYQDNH